MPESISSLQNPRVKSLVRLRNSSHRRRQSRFLIEGYREISRALESGWPIETLYFCDKLFKQPGSFELVHACESKGIEVVLMTVDPFSKCAYREGSDGLLSVATARESSLEEFIPRQPALLVIAESIEKPGNLGAIMRTADAAGADALIIVDSVTDPYNPNCIRASQGAIFNLPFFCCDSSTALKCLNENQIQTVTTSPDANVNLWQLDLCLPTALVFGSEDIGLSDKWLSAGTGGKLPMQGITDSLNVSATVAVALFEAIRQRTIASA